MTAKTNHKPKRFLVLGGSGLIGGRVLSQLGPAYAIGTYVSREIPFGHRFDLGSDDIGFLLDQMDVAVTHALVLGASTKIDESAKNPAGTKRVNVDGTLRTLDALMRRNVVPIFASSDAVYDGTKGEWTESDALHPITEYGRQKLAVEQFLQVRREPWLALRICKVLDQELSPAGLLGPWTDDIKQRRLIRCAVDQIFTPVGLDDVVKAVLRLVEVEATGIFNLGGAEKVTRYELLKLLVESMRELDVVNPAIEQCKLRDFNFPEPRPLDASVSVSKLRAAIGYKPESLASICRRAAQNFARSQHRNLSA